MHVVNRTFRFGSSFQRINSECKLSYAFGGDGGGVPHVPIPNTTVKPSSADGTWTAGSWESRTPPSKEPLPMLFGGGFYLFISKNAGLAISLETLH